MPNDDWMGELADEAQGVTYSDLVAYFLLYLGATNRGPAFLAWFRARRLTEKEEARGRAR